MNGFLNGKQAKNFELRLWVAEKVTVENTDSMNKEFRSKISVTSTLPNDEDVPPSSELKLLSCNDTIMAKATATPYKNKTITKYEYKIDENEWQDGSDEIEFTEQEQGNHTIKLRVTDNLGVVSDEVEQTINVDIKETEYTSIYGRQIPVASCLNGLYKVEHNINSDWNKEEYRYVGVSEKLNNYVKFNNEIWRIIGLVNVKTSSGQMEQRLKIIRQDGIEGQKDFGSYVWDGKNKGVGSSLSTYGSNDWTDSRVKDMLNGLYYNSIDGYCYDRSDWYYECGFTGKDDKVKGLDATARNMVDGEIVWSLGGARSVNITPDDFYVLERGSDVYGDNIEWSKSTDVGNNYKGIGLIYPSDFGYATNGGFLGWEKCININFTYWSLDEDYRLECKHNDWLNPTSGTIWTITNNSYNAYQVFGIDTSTSSYYDQVNPYGYAFHEGKIWPTLYLKKNISIVNDDNDGSIEKPYELQLNG